MSIFVGIFVKGEASFCRNNRQKGAIEIISAFLTTFLTVFSGVLVYVLGQITLKFFIEPINDLLKAIGETANKLTYYAPIYSNSGTASQEAMDEAHISLRKTASELRAKNFVIKRKGCLKYISDIFVPSDHKIKEASSLIIGLSNSVYRHEDLDFNNKRLERIHKLLGIKLEP